jgi:hypothetical protein
VIFKKAALVEQLEHDIRCSTACTRAIVWALIFSAVAAAMWRPLEKSEAVSAFLKYTSLRLEMSELIDDLQVDYCWQTRLIPEVATKISRLRLSELAAYICGNALNWTYEQPWFHRSGRRVDLRVIQNKLEEPNKIIDLLADLIQSKTLEISSTASYAAKGPIGRWKKLLEKRLEAAGQLPPGQRSILVNRKLLESLTWGDIVELSKYEPPSFSDAETTRAQLNISLLSIPSIDLRIGAAITEFGILFSIVYFFLYQREAFRPKTPPASGTFFAVFLSSRSTRILFILMISIPPLAAALLASKSAYPTDFLANSCIAVLVILVSASIRIKAKIYLTVA